MTDIYNDALWHAINQIARQHGKSCSGLAIACGLAPTAFNLSKRQSKYGQPRWLSSGTVAKILQGAQITFIQFAQIVDSFVSKNKKK